ncbi:hypothetical protein ACJX0J_010271, partial [Zea mays]
ILPDSHWYTQRAISLVSICVKELSDDSISMNPVDMNMSPKCDCINNSDAKDHIHLRGVEFVASVFLAINNIFKAKSPEAKRRLRVHNNSLDLALTPWRNLFLV